MNTNGNSSAPGKIRQEKLYSSKNVVNADQTNQGLKKAEILQNTMENNVYECAVEKGNESI